ncbi:hypothetical protein [Actinoplanes sp. GCM10030250]|uniref:hypothetical protein n=1 Tax=Actinoplanes sp. GCM10030250 TaxID=3273376 RepID=UPI00360869B5
MNITTLLDLIAHREATTSQTAAHLRQQITTLTAQLADADTELADLATTRTTLQTLTATEFTADDPTIASTPYQQILTTLRDAPDGMRAKDICLAVGVDPTPGHVESARSRLKRMVNRNILTENEPGVFALTEKRT